MEFYMNDNKKIALDVIMEKQSVFTGLSDKIWEYAELSLKEYRSCDEYVLTLNELGFEVEREVCGIPTAFLGRCHVYLSSSFGFTGVFVLVSS